MIMPENPIHDFSGLKNLLSRMGYHIEQAIGYRPLEIADVNINDLKRNIEFTDDGIFLIDDATQERHQIFLYKRNYHLDLYGKPRFHIRKCQTIQSFMNSGSFKAEYRRANTETVTVADMDDGFIDKEISDLPLCSYCAKMIYGSSYEMDSTEFVEILKETEDYQEPTNVDVDIFGYTKDWEEISLAYRTSQSFTCEECGLQITDPFDRQYIHTHHKNGNKTDNRLSNLQCLCLRCHAQVDEFHRHNLMERGANRIIFQEFKDKYIDNDLP